MSDTCLNHIESYWQKLTVSANELFDQGDCDKALSSYKEALYRAEVLNKYTNRCENLNIPFKQVYIISCNNLANTYEELGKFKEAEKLLRRVVYFLFHLAGNKNHNLDEIKSELKRATLSYLCFVKKTNTGKEEQKQLIRVLQEEISE